MKNIYLDIILATLLFCFGCTQNNGHLGTLFGSWTLTEITKDGEAADHMDETIFSFQNKIVQITRLTDYPYSVEYRYGNFSHSGDILTMQFQAGDSGYNITYLAPEWIFFPQDGKPIRFTVVSLKGDSMILELDSDGDRYVYRFRKTM